MVIRFTFEFLVHYLSSLPVEGFSLNFGHPFISMTQCAVPMNQYVDSRSQCKVIGFTLEFCLGSTSL